MNGWKRIWIAVLAVATLTLASQRAHAQQAEDLESPVFLGRVACGDGRQCDEYRLHRDTKIAHLWYIAQIAVERTLGRQILTDRQWRNYHLSDMQHPLEPRVRRTETLPALINGSGASEFVSLELLVQLNNGTNSSGRNPFNTPAMCNGRREHPLRFGVSALNLRRFVREEVTLLNVERLLPRGCETRGISTVDDQRVLIPASGGTTVGQRIDQITRDGNALIASGQITVARLRQDRQQMRELDSRRGSTIEPERRQAFDAYVDRVLALMEQRGTAAAVPVAAASVQPAAVPAAPSAAPAASPRVIERVVYRYRDALVWFLLAMTFIGAAFVGFAFDRERRLRKNQEWNNALLHASKKTLQDKVERLENLEHAPISVRPPPPPPPYADLRPDLERQRLSYEQSLQRVRESHETSLSLANQAKVDLAKERDQDRSRANDLATQIVHLKAAIGSLLGEAFLQLKKLYNVETVEGRDLHEPLSTISMVFSQLKMQEPQLAPAGIDGERRLTKAFASMGDALSRSRHAAPSSGGNGNGGRNRQMTKPGIHSIPALEPKRSFHVTLPPPGMPSDPIESAASQDSETEPPKD